MKYNKRFFLFLGLTILWILFIFSFSMQTGEESSEISGGIVERIVALIFSSNFQHADMLEHLIRKAAHFTEYFILGVFASLTVRETKCKRQFFAPWMIGTLVACCDETIQLFSNGRSGQVTDVMLDSAGVLCGCVVLYVVCNIFSIIPICKTDSR